MTNLFPRVAVNLILPGCLLILSASCSPTYLNKEKNDLRVPLEERSLNSNPQTESFLEPVSALSSDEQPRAKAAESRPLSNNGYFVGLAISGGGSRSANFAAACMFQLQRLGLLQKVQCISAVIGGAMTATYYCSAPDSDWNPQIVQDKLTHPFETDLIVDMLLPWNLIGLGLGTVNRTDALADDFAAVLFDQNGRRLTFRDLRPDRPRLLINSTDMQTGRPFIFDNSDFDQINSDLDRYPLANAVSASSAIPAMLDPITLRDYSTTFRQYVHLVDGGVCDNLGVQTLVNSYAAETQSASNPYPSGAVLIIIDAGVPINSRLGSEADLGGMENLLAGLNVSSAVLLNRASTATLSEILVMNSLGTYTVSELRDMIEKLHRDHFVEIRDRAGRPVRVVHLSLSQVGELSTMTFGNSVNSITTKYDLPPDDAYNLYRAADILFQRRFDALLKPVIADLNGHGP
jgi:predicted acylesterase/phospholipase RssA